MQQHQIKIICTQFFHRFIILQNKREALLQSIEKLQQAVAFIDWKQNFYDEVLSGKTKYYSNLVPELMKES